MPFRLFKRKGSEPRAKSQNPPERHMDLPSSAELGFKVPQKGNITNSGHTITKRLLILDADKAELIRRRLSNLARSTQSILEKHSYAVTRGGFPILALLDGNTFGGHSGHFVIRLDQSGKVEIVPVPRDYEITSLVSQGAPQDIVLEKALNVLMSRAKMYADLRVDALFW